MNRHESMNRIFRLVWSAVRGVWVPAAENAKGRDKSGRSRALLAAQALVSVTAVGTLSLGTISPASAAPTGGNTSAIFLPLSMPQVMSVVMPMSGA